MEPVELSVDKQAVAGRLYGLQTKIKKPAFLFLHGWTGKPNDNAAETLAKNGYYAMTLIMRGHKGSDGDIKTVTALDSLHDACAAYDFLKTYIGNETPIVVVGNSYGSYIAILLTEKRRVDALSLRVPAGYPDELLGLPKWGKGHDDPIVAKWRTERTHYSDNKALHLLHDFKGPVQIIEAERDDVVPHQTVMNYKNAVSNETQLNYHFMKDWPHSLGTDRNRNQQFQQLLVTWANQLESTL